MRAILLFITIVVSLNVQGQIFHENFEIPDSVVSSSNGSGVWALNNRVATSGTYSDSASLNNIGDTIILTTLPFSTIGHDSIFLYFNHICKIEFFDSWFLEVSTDSGITWVQLTDDMGGSNNNCVYHGMGLFRTQGSRFQEASYGAWEPGQTSVPENMWWKREIFDVSSVLGNASNAQIRFVVRDVNTNGGSGRAGWFIDDIFIDSTLNTNLYTFMNRIEGNMYVDMNSNQIKDMGEPGILFKSITETTTSNWTFTNWSGDFLLPTFTVGATSVQPDSIMLNSPYFNVVPNIHTANFTSIGQVDTMNDFALQPILTVNDLEVLICPHSSCFATQSALYRILYYNKGTTILNPTIIFYHDNIYSYGSSSLTPTSISPDSIVWTPAPIYPLQSGYIFVTLYTTPGQPIGTPVFAQARIEPITGDINVSNNFSIDTTNVCTSFDPNIITVNYQYLTPIEVAGTVLLEYTIYFQNTGNDTARYVRADNLIPSELDLSTFELVGYSHDLVIQNNAFINPRLLSFTFNNINLPDSNINEPESHGFVKYRIKPISTLIAGDSIANRADIYFDFNAPVGTNTAYTEIVDPTSIGENLNEPLSWNLYPNPVNDELNVIYILKKEGMVTLDIFNLYGQHVKTLYEKFNPAGTFKHVFDISSLSNGVYFTRFSEGEIFNLKKFVKIN